MTQTKVTPVVRGLLNGYQLLLSKLRYAKSFGLIKEANEARSGLNNIGKELAKLRYLGITTKSDDYEINNVIYQH